MVTRASRFLFIALLAAGVVLSVSGKDLAEYRIGDQIVEDIVTPVPLMVVDPVATKALKDKEELRIPVIFRYNESALATVETGLRATFAVARSNFVSQMEDTFRTTQLTAEQMAAEEFQKLIESFKRRNKTFPLSEEMAMEWARGNVVLPEQISLSARVHQAMAGLIRYDNLNNTPKLGSRVLLVPVKRETETITLEDVKVRGFNEPRTNLLTMSRARLALLENFSAEESDMAKFATRALRANCFVESDLTRAARARHTDPLFVADNYQAGQVIARKGQLVEGKIMAALTQLQEKTAAGRLAAEVTHEREKVVLGQAQVAQIRASNRWLIAGLALAGTLLFLLLAWLALRRRPEPSRLPMLVSGATTVPLLSDSGDRKVVPTGADFWQQRALAAEQNAERALAAIRSGVFAQLKEKLVGSLVSQRGQLLEAQRSAAAEMDEMERRLNELHAPLQERLRTYESRIADLEKALAAKGDENRELIKAKIELMRKQLRAERSKNHLQFN